MLTPWSIAFSSQASTGDLAKDTVAIYGVEVEYSYYEYDDLAKYSFGFMLFVLFWTSQFFVAFGQIVLGLSFSKVRVCEEQKTGEARVATRFDRRCRFLVGVAFSSLSLSRRCRFLVANTVCLSQWYFNPEKGIFKQSSVFRDCLNVLRYHLGTAAFGSLVVAIVQMVRAVLTYVQNHINNMAATQVRNGGTSTRTCFRC